jgi:prevent-host-death family protein
MKTMRSIYETKAHFSELVAEVERTGRVIVISRHGKPVADLVPHRSSKDPLKADPGLSGAAFKGDPCAPVNEADWPEVLR